MAKPFLYIFSFFAARRKTFFTVFISVFLITCFFALKIKPVEDISKILPNDRASSKFNEVLGNARFADKLVLMISLKDSNRSSPETLTAFADSFSSRLSIQYPGLIHSVESRVNDSLVPQWMDMIIRHLPVFLEPRDYRAFDSLADAEILNQMLVRDIRTLASPAGFALKSWIVRDPLGIANPILKKIRDVRYDENFDLYDGHIITKDEKRALVFIQPAFPSNNTGKNTELLAGIDQILASLKGGPFADVNGRYFGGVAVSAGNAAQLKKDGLLTISLATGFLILFLAWYFKRKSAPLIILLPVLFGALFSLSMLYWIQGSISVIALAAGSLVLGIAINYSLHVYNHFRHRGDMQTVLEDLSFPLTIGGLTTIGGFLCLQFVRSGILKDLGLFAAFSLIGASLSALIFLPHLILLSSPGGKNKTSERDSWIGRLSNYPAEKNKWLVGGILFGTLLCSLFVSRVRFDQDMMHMNYMPEPLKEAEAELNRISAYSLRSVYLVTEGATLDQALKRQENLEDKIKILQDKKVIRKYNGIFRLLISDSLQKERIRFWNAYWTGERKRTLSTNLRQAGLRAGFRAAALDSFTAIWNIPYASLDATEHALLRKGLADDFILEAKDRVSLISLLKVEPENKARVYAAFASDPEVTVLDKQYVVTELLRIVSADFNQIAWMTSILVFVILLITYGRIELALVSFIPMVIAFIWILGIMGLAGIEFNIVNIILSALIFGLGDDYSLFIMDGLLQEYKTGKKNLPSYKSSIVLSAITTLAGLGVLIFAKHPAMRSIALISILGILSVVLIAQVLIPFFFQILIRNRLKKGFYPWTASGLFKSIFSLSYFAAGSWLVTIFGYVMVKWNPFAGPRARWVYHRVLSFYTWSVLYIMGNVKKKMINGHQDFSKPCVMIANHQSFLDILVMTMLHPKVVLLTNNWVWNSPIFGRLVRIAGYYPVASGIENSIPYLQKQVDAGYSIAVFPEGTRSADDQVRRFHKGAFFIAEQLSLDVLPVVIHGTGYTMSKGDFLLKDGYVRIKYLPRIKPNDMYFGVDYTERAKYVGAYFRQQYALLKKENEQPAFFKERLIYNYLYKGPVLEWYLRVKIKIEKNYQLFHELIPKQGQILDIGCGYGFLTYMLQFAAPERILTGYDYDEEKIAVANHAFCRNENINFITADATEMPIAPADAIILSDVLHYLSPEKQEGLIQKCMYALQPGGILIIRDGDRDLKEKHGRTRMTEFFSTRFFSFNKTEGKPLHFLSGKTIQDLASRHQMHCRLIGGSVHTSNQLFVITHTESAYEKV